MIPENRENSCFNLWVCWKKPRTVNKLVEPVLSFMSPAIEEEFERENSCNLIRAREVSSLIRVKARKLYVELVANIGVAPLKKNSTFRQSLAKKNEASQWWYHNVSFKDCEADSIFNLIIMVLTIQSVAQKYSLRKLVLVGAPWEVIATLKNVFQIRTIEAISYRKQISKRLIRGLVSRIGYFVKILFAIFIVRNFKQSSKGFFDVVLSGFWDWSFWWDSNSKTLKDRYFKLLPQDLKNQGVKSIAWIAWFDPHSKSGKRKQTVREILFPLHGRKDVIILQSFLNAFDIFKALLDFRPLLTFFKACKKNEFKMIFRRNGLDFYPLFSESLIYGFVDYSIPHCNLVALSTQRAFCKYKTKTSLSFLEHFPYSRAHYEGVRRSKTGTICFAVQHASYSSEKTFLFFHPILEFKGDPDGHSIPHPNYVFAMGTLGQKHFLECGYRKEKVLLTGSPRYDHIHQWSYSQNVSLESKKYQFRSKYIRLLMIASFDLNWDMQMIEAVLAAVSGLNGIHLCIRNHPLHRINNHPKFYAYMDTIEISKNSLDEDLAQADLILFTYSTVAEEALIQGKPVWQWMPNGFNGSALAEICSIPKFASIEKLRRDLIKFQIDPISFMPSKKTRLMAIEQLFFKDDGKNTERVTSIIKRFI